MSVSYGPVSRRSGRPLREQVRALLAARIGSGELTAGDQLPTEAELARQLEVSLAPVRSALGDLADAGLIRRRAGLGTFVAERPIRVAVGLLPSLTQTLRTADVDFLIEVVDRELVHPREDIAAGLGITRRAEAIWVRRAATVAARRAVVVDSWFPRDRFAPLLTDERLLEPNRSLYELLRSEFGVRLTPGPGQLSVSPCSDDLLPLLDLPFGAPIVTFRTHGRDEAGRIAEMTTVHYDASRFVFDIHPGKRPA